MEPSDLDENTLAVHIKVDDDGDFQIFVASNLAEDHYDEDEIQYFNDLLNGISFTLNFGVEQMAAQGTLMRKMYEVKHEEDENEALSERDEDIINALSGSNIVHFKKRVH